MTKRNRQITHDLEQLVKIMSDAHERKFTSDIHETTQLEAPEAKVFFEDKFILKGSEYRGRSAALFEFDAAQVRRFNIDFEIESLANSGWIPVKLRFPTVQIPVKRNSLIDNFRSL